MICMTYHPLVCPPFFDKWNVLAKGLNWEKAVTSAENKDALLNQLLKKSLLSWQRRNVNLIGHSLSYGPPGWDEIAEIMFYY